MALAFAPWIAQVPLEPASTAMTLVFVHIGTDCAPILGLEVTALGATLPVAETGELLTVTATVDAAITKRPTKALRNGVLMCATRL